VSAPGLALAGLVFAASLTPSLLPRDPALQGVLAGTVAALAHEIAAAMQWLWATLGLPRWPAAARRLALRIGAGAGLVAVVWGLSQAKGWQDVTRVVLGLPPADVAGTAVIAGLGALCFVTIWLIARAFGAVLRRVARAAGRVLPPRLALGAGLVLAAWAFWAVIDGALVRTGFAVADASFAAAEAVFDDDAPQPVLAGRSGGPGSVVAWEDLGRHGRRFVATAPTAAEIAAFTGAPALDPVRVYVGRAAADTPEERAALALDDLIRLGGFDRSTLIVAVPPGTGWMDPGAHDSIEFMLGGDVATVGVQYSHLTSVLSLATHPEYGIAQAQALFDAVYGYWHRLPPGDRPRLYLFGLSQGAFNSQRALPILDLLGDPIDGALWTGSPFFAPYWTHVRDRRQPGSTAWRPVFGNGSLARTLTQDGPPEAVVQPWGPIRLVFLNYGSDPIVNFTFASAWRQPDWMREPRAPDVSPGFRWFPLVTMFQLALDSAISLQMPRFGHFYVAHDYITGWAALIDIPGWSEARADALRAVFAAREAPW
jgi:uncharacterized membrane protein